MPATGFYQANGSPDVYQALGNGVLNYIPDASAFGGDYGKVQKVNSLNDIYQPDIQAQANAQVDPTLNATIDSLNNEKTTDQNATNQTLKALKDTFAQRAESDPYARQGVVSSRANAVETNNEGNQVSAVGNDLSAKLSDIASRLGTAQASAQTQKTGLLSTLSNTYAQNNQNYQTAQNTQKQQQFTDQLAANKVTPIDLGGSVELINGLGQIVGNSSKSAAPSSSSDTAFQTLLAKILGGSDTSTSTNTTTPTDGLPQFSADYIPSVTTAGNSTQLQGGSTNLQGSGANVQGSGENNSAATLAILQKILSNNNATLNVVK